jgi:hypothetical protein
MEIIMTIYNPKCPYCDVEIDIEDHVGIPNDCGAEIYYQAIGSCPQCGKGFTWTDYFVLSDCFDVEEISD